MFLHTGKSSRFLIGGLVVLLAAVPLLVLVLRPAPRTEPPLNYEPRKLVLDTSGFYTVITHLTPWNPNASLEEISAFWKGIVPRNRAFIERALQNPEPGASRGDILLTKAELLCYEGDPAKAYEALQQARTWAESKPLRAEEYLYTIIFFQGVAGLRIGENENCILCRGESSCIIPIAPSAVHTNPHGSRLAIKHFTEYLQMFPDDLAVRWLLNVAHMTLGEYPHKVDPEYLLRLDRFFKSEFDIGKFHDIGHLVNLNRFNMAGGAIMDDFDNDGLLDIITTTMDPTAPMAFYRNKGDGTFEDRTREAGLEKQLGGLYCVQADYNNDGHMDVFVCRGAWLTSPIRPSLLRNNGDGTFTDVTEKAGLLTPVNSISACWADYDNDGFLDLFVCCERQRCRLYRNKGDGTFEEVALTAGIQTLDQQCKGATWIDQDNDGWPDLFINNLNGTAQLFHNNRNGTFTDVTKEMGIDGPPRGFACWAWDFDNDGWLDIFATCYDQTESDLVKGLLGQPHDRAASRLYRNKKGKGFENVAKQAGLEDVYATMGCNFGDFDGDGYLDFYLGTGNPKLDGLVPNRMFKNQGGKRFADITSSSGTGHLQKGHAVACGDWDRDGNIDIFIQMGGAIPGDRYHNILFQNPGKHGNSWLTVKLAGNKTDRASKGTNRCAIGARIKVVTAGPKPLTIHRHVSSGSSFGANPLQQTIGLGKADRVATLEIHWPTSKTTQVFHDVAVNQAIQITEFASDYRKLDWKPIRVPK